MTPVRFKFMTPEGDPLANTAFEIELPCPGYHVEPSGVVLPRVVEATTDVDGEALIELWPLTNPYEVTAYDPVAKSELFYKFIVPVLPEGETELRLQDIIVTGTLITQSTDPDILAQMVDKYVATLAVANTILTNLNTAQDASDTAVAAAEAAEISATTASDAALSATASAGTATTAAGTATTAAGAAETARDVVLAALVGLQLISEQIETVPGTYTWNKPVGLPVDAIVEVIAQGSGAGAGGCPLTGPGDVFHSSAGGAGGFVIARCLASLLDATGSIVVGAAGIGVSGADGTNGAACSFTSGTDSVTAGGGVKGLAIPAVATRWWADYPPGIGGTVSVAGGFTLTISADGEQGKFSTNEQLTGAGGNSFYGPGGRARFLTTAIGSIAGDNARAPGAGGSGALNQDSPGGPHAAVAGGNGAVGLVIVRVYA